MPPSDTASRKKEGGGGGDIADGSARESERKTKEGGLGKGKRR